MDSFLDTLRIGQRLHAKDKRGTWYAATVVDLRQHTKEVRVHFMGWHGRYDEWVPLSRGHLSPENPGEGRDGGGSDSDDDEYEVESILARRTVDGVVRFLVRWKGYGADDDTWEPSTHLPNVCLGPEKPEEGSDDGGSGGSGGSGSGDDDDEADTQTADGGAEYEVESILGRRTVDGVVQYLVRWKGYGADGDTWEPPAHLSTARAIVREYEAKSAQSLPKSLSDHAAEEERPPPNGFGNAGHSNAGSARASASLERFLSASANVQCSVCLVAFASMAKSMSVYRLTCGHIFCAGCLEPWCREHCPGRPTCPQCRKAFAGLRHQPKSTVANIATCKTAPHARGAAAKAKEKSPRKRPRGRAPKGKVWSGETGEWVDNSVERLAHGSNGGGLAHPAKKRARGQPPKGAASQLAWDDEKEEWLAGPAPASEAAAQGDQQADTVPAVVSAEGGGSAETAQEEATAKAQEEATAARERETKILKKAKELREKDRQEANKVKEAKERLERERASHDGIDATTTHDDDEDEEEAGAEAQSQYPRDPGMDSTLGLWAQLVIRCARALKRSTKNLPAYTCEAACRLQVATIGHKDVLRILELSRQFFGEDGQGRHALSAEASEYVVRQLKSAIDRINGCGGSAGAKAALAAVKLIAGAGKVSVINPKTGAVSVIDSDVPDDPRDEPSLGWLIGRTIRRSPPEGEVGDDIEVVIEAQAPPAYEEVAAAMGSVTVPVNKLVARCNIKRTAPLELVTPQAEKGQLTRQETMDLLSAHRQLFMLQHERREQIFQQQHKESERRHQEQQRRFLHEFEILQQQQMAHVRIEKAEPHDNLPLADTIPADVR